MSFYSIQEDSARVAFDLVVGAPDIREARLQRFDATRGEWLTVDHVALESVSTDREQRPTSRIRRRYVVLAGTLVACDILLGAFLYFVPGMQFSPQAGHLHDLGRTVGLIMFGDVLAVAMYAYRASRS